MSCFKVSIVIFMAIYSYSGFAENCSCSYSSDYRSCKEGLARVQRGEDSGFACYDHCCVDGHPVAERPQREEPPKKEPQQSTSLAEGIYNSMKCDEVLKQRCLEVQEFGHEPVGPRNPYESTHAVISPKGKKIALDAIPSSRKPTVREIVCCEDDAATRESIIGYILNGMSPDRIIGNMIGRDINEVWLSRCPNITSIEDVNDSGRNGHPIGVIPILPKGISPHIDFPNTFIQ